MSVETVRKIGERVRKHKLKPVFCRLRAIAFKSICNWEPIVWCNKWDDEGIWSSLIPQPSFFIVKCCIFSSLSLLLCVKHFLSQKNMYIRNTHENQTLFLSLSWSNQKHRKQCNKIYPVFLNRIWFPISFMYMQKLSPSQKRYLSFNNLFQKKSKKRI